MTLYFMRRGSLALFVGAFSLGAIWSAHAACPAHPKVGSSVTVSGIIADADALGIYIKGCRIVVMPDDNGWLGKCRTGKKLSATGTYREIPMPFIPVPIIGDIRRLTCGSAKLK